MVVLSSDAFESFLVMLADVALHPDKYEEENVTEQSFDEKDNGNGVFLEENSVGERDYERM